MKTKLKIALCSALLLAGCNDTLSTFVQAKAQDVKKLKDFANNFSHENLICAAYHLFVHQCLKNKNPNDQLADQYLKLADEMIERGIQAGRMAGVSDKAISARMELAVEKMKDDTNSNCANISVLFKPHAKSCKALYENGPQILMDQLK